MLKCVMAGMFDIAKLVYSPILFTTHATCNVGKLTELIYIIYQLNRSVLSFKALQLSVLGLHDRIRSFTMKLTICTVFHYISNSFNLIL
jgi:hypothetical protein